MITPLCSISNNASNKFCVCENCEVTAFMCKFCENEECENRHIHNNKVETMKIISFKPLLEDLLNLEQVYKGKISANLNQQAQKTIKYIQQITKKHLQIVDDMFKNFRINEEIDKILKKINDKNYSAILGKDMKVLYEHLSTKQYLTNNQTHHQIEKLNKQVNKLFQECQYLFSNYQKKINGAVQFPKVVSKSNRQLASLLTNVVCSVSQSKPDRNQKKKPAARKQSKPTKIIQQPQIKKTLKKGNSPRIQTASSTNQPKPRKQPDFISISQSGTNQNIQEFCIRLYQTAQIGIQDCTSRIEINNQNHVAYFMRGTIYLDHNRFQEAQENFDKAISINPRHVDSYFMRAFLFDSLNMLSKAENDYSKVIQIDNRCAEAYNNRGLIHVAKSRVNQAQQDFTQAICINPHFADPYFNRGVMYDNQKNFIKAEQYYTLAISANSKYKQAYRARGIVREAINKAKQAQQDYNKAIQIDSDYKLAYKNRALLYQIQHRYYEALKDFNTILLLDPQDYQTYYDRGILHFNEGFFKKALQDFNICIDNNPNEYPQYYQIRGLCYRKLNRLVEASSDTIKGLKLRQ